MTCQFLQTVRETCLWLPEVEEFVSHGSPNFRVRGKTFASYMVNHHGDGRVSLWLNAPSGSKETYVDGNPKHYFVPAYVGGRGWLGVHLNQGLVWGHVVERVREAYEKVAPLALRAAIGKTPAIAAPTQRMSESDINPMASPRGGALLKTLRSIAATLPETHEAVNFGYPVWQAGRKTYLWARCVDRGFSVYVWVGVETQALLVADERFRIPAYMGHNGWIELDVSKYLDRDEVAALALQSYRHFALRRMLQQLPVR